MPPVTQPDQLDQTRRLFASRLITHAFQVQRVFDVLLRRECAEQVELLENESDGLLPHRHQTARILRFNFAAFDEYAARCGRKNAAENGQQRCLS